MGHLTIIGLGPGSPKDLTREAWEVLSQLDEVWLRTTHHPVVRSLPAGLDVRSFDHLYEAAETFEDVYVQITAQILSLAARAQGVTYAVPGHPLMGESTVTRILSATMDRDLPIRIVAGLSFLEPSLTALAYDALDGLQIIDALEMLALHHPPLNSDFPALIGQVYSRAIASELKLVLMNQYPDTHETVLIDAAGTPAQTVRRLPLYEIDRHPVSPLTSLYIAPYLPPAYADCSAPVYGSFQGFQNTIAQLRAPDGCPWDRKQTHASLRPNLLEETYEVLAAIDEDDTDALREELGDLLLQVVLQTQIAIESGEFDMAEVIAGIDAKLKHRHPHVWGQVEVDGAETVTKNWEALKREERVANGKAKRSALDSIPTALPALAQAMAYIGRAARVGGGLKSITEVETYVENTLAAWKAAESQREQHRAIGELLLALVAWAQWREVDPESALREANLRFVRHFRQLESLARERGVSIADLAPEKRAQLWARTMEL
ncbi:MAG: nucleoside triphosphate pyrophosphohydrolase [Anaerolineales bacterium]